MNTVRSLPKTKPPPVPKTSGHARAPTPAHLEDAVEELEVTFDDAPLEVSKVDRSGVRELRASRPSPPRPAGVPRPDALSRPPPLPVAVAPAVTSTPAPAPSPEAASELETRADIAPAAPSTPAPAPGPEAPSELEMCVAMAPVATSAPAHAPIQEASSELEMHTAVKPQLYVLARTVWFFAIFVTTGAFRWLVGEWRRAAARANAIRPL